MPCRNGVSYRRKVSSVGFVSRMRLRPGGATALGLPQREAFLRRGRRVEQVEPVGSGGRLATAAHAQLGQDARDMDAGGFGGDKQLGADLRVRPPGGD